MTDPQELAKEKLSRRQCKAAVTRKINKIDKFIAENDIEKVKQEAGSLKDTFERFEQQHEKFHSLLEDIDEEEQSDSFFFEVQSNYIKALTTTRSWLAQDTKEPTMVKDETSNLSCESDVVGLVSLPKLELKPFDGDPIKYHSFIAMFEESIERVVRSERSRLTHLVQFTSGDALDAIRSCTLIEGDGGYKQARSILQKRFGDRHLVMERVVKQLRQGKPARSPSELRRLADELSNSLATLKQLGKLHEVDSQNLILEVIERFPHYMKLRWKRHAVEIKRDKGDYPKFEELVKYMEKEVDEATDPVYGQVGVKSSDNGNGKFKKFGNVTTSTSFATGTYKRPPCILCKQDHKLLYCSKFKAMRPQERVTLVNQKKLCENCLLENHVTANCRNTSVCTVFGCGRKHSKFLHLSNVSNAVGNDVVNASTDVSSSSQNSNIYMPIISAKVNGLQRTHVLLDNASSSTFCTRELARSLGLSGEVAKYSLNTLSKSNEFVSSHVVSFDICSVDGTESLKLTNVFVVDKIPVKSSPVRAPQFSHLKGLPISGGSDRVHILIGQDHSEALVPLEVKKGNRGEPFAVRTLLGWTLNGPAGISNRVSRSVVSHFISTTADVGHDINVLWNLENDGISDGYSWSVEDHKVIKLWDEHCRKVDGHYELPIPWKDHASVPNNYSMACSRLNSNKKSLIRRGLYDRYCSEIAKLLTEGHAEPVSTLGVKPNKIWYLPHQAVISDKKPGKLRIVFDCAAKFSGESLNDKCMQGPNLSNRLLNVLLKFRQHPYALMADVKAMYYQVLIPVYDRDALRFLWFNEAGEVVHYRMTRHVFGGIWCASSSAYAMMHVLLDNPNDVDELVADTVRRCFYVDDCLRSLAEREHVMRVIEGTRNVLCSGGFQLTKFVVNDEQMLSLIPEEDRAREVKFVDETTCNKALGITWNVDDDQFRFDVNLDCKSGVSLTRRKMLSLASSIYDPLGLVNLVVVQGKLILQETTCNRLAWDDPVGDELCHKWMRWLASLCALQKVRIPRCIKPFNFNDAFLELHHFSDASQMAYGCCSYLRCVDKQGHVHVALVISKSRVAPVKCVTIPRLELQAAVLSAKIDVTLREELDIELGPSHFWTDSEIVISYISNESRRFHVFVSNRVSVIQQSTSADQWHFVPGAENPADLLTRGETLESLDTSKWLEGPQFLHTFKHDWVLKDSDCSLNSVDPEVRKTTCLTVSVEADEPVDELIQYYSSWYSLKRAVAWLLRFENVLRIGQVQFGRLLSVFEIERAEKSILRYVQRKCYADEVRLISNGHCVSKSSALSSLDPFLDDEGLLRVGGRLKHARVHDDFRHPYLVPKGHPIAKLIACDYHNVAHCGTEWVVSEIRKRYWIVQARSVVKSVSQACMFCKRMFAKVCLQKMSDLPPERIESGNKPFTFTGADVFGYFLVKQGRAEVKRYGCLFTCLNTRAVHLEKLNSLETDSFLNGFRRFAARRGMPKKVWSDNGTNFTGGNAELARNWKLLDEKSINDFIVKEGVEWHFNPPGASHMGGVWERLIRTVRKVLVGLVGVTDCRLTDEGLETLFCEIEFIVNGRPITKTSEDVLDAAALTPNHLLMFSGCPAQSPGVFRDTDLYRRRWRQVQHLTNTFWRRWIKEYLPELQVRAKWHQTKSNLKEGDLVLVLGENTPRGLWPMGLVLEVYESNDGLVRSAKVKTKSTELHRPITKLVLLEGSL